ncbi:hypothetical protein ANN_08614 [Periplaneta americana]|uniref:Tc1-like transposase DDE domain-containing protein n=1 Tax=Periplaneta americana TaxID=6978 RepID=A0ABQ8T1Y1_PERAM|nr:hypothetical protein ANN_08614 [Periplaneta americana]
MQWYADSNVHRLDWSAHSRDLNPIEHLWNELDRRLRSREMRPTSIVQLSAMLQEEWRRIPVDILHKLVESMPDNPVAVIATRGGTTRKRKGNGSGKCVTVKTTEKSQSGGPGIELIPHPGRSSMSLCGKKKDSTYYFPFKGGKDWDCPRTQVARVGPLYYPRWNGVHVLRLPAILIPCAPPPSSPTAYMIPLPFHVGLTTLTSLSTPVPQVTMSPVESPQCIALPPTTNDHGGAQP